ncbi:MAG: hypothetical protein ABIP94_20355, partial [Planctomycetota bacterium]
MTKHRTAAVLFAVLCALLAALWAWWSADPALAPRGTTNTATADAAAATAADSADAPAEATGAQAPASEVTDREAVPRKATATTGSLLVHVVYGGDKSPAADVEVAITRGGADALFETPRERTDETGTARFEELVPGRVYAHVERGDMGGGKRCEITAGQQN